MVSTNPLQPNLRAYDDSQSLPYCRTSGPRSEMLTLFMLRGPNVTNTVSEKVKFPSVSSKGSNVRCSFSCIFFHAFWFSGSRAQPKIVKDILSTKGGPYLGNDVRKMPKWKTISEHLTPSENLSHRLPAAQAAQSGHLEAVPHHAPLQTISRIRQKCDPKR